MADETTTDVTNSEATQTDASAATDTNTSPTTETETPNQQADDADKGGDDAAKADDKSKADADPLDGDDGIAADPKDKSGEDGDDASNKGDDNAVLFGAPEGEYELSLPEGMTLDAEALEQFTPTAKKFGLSNDGLAQLASEAYPVVEKQVAKANVEAVVAQRKAWEDASRTAISGGKDADGNAIAADPVFAGENQEAVMTTAAKALDRFGGDAKYPGVKFDKESGEMVEGTFRDFLKSTGLSNHPGMVRFAYLAGKAISEDSDFHRSGDVPKAKLSREEKYYGENAS